MNGGPLANSSDANSVSGFQYTPLDSDIKLKTACCCCSSGFFCKIPECFQGYGYTNACLCFQCKQSSRVVGKCIACYQSDGSCACCNVENGMSSELLHCSGRCVGCCCCEEVHMCSQTMCPTTCCREICWCCCCDCRFALPCNDDVPCELALCGLYCKQSEARKNGKIGGPPQPGPRMAPPVAQRIAPHAKPARNTGSF